MSLETPPQNIPDSSEEDEEEEFTRKDLKFNDSVTVRVKWPVSEEVVSLIIILSDASKTEISAFRIDLSADEDLNFPDSLSRITIYGLDPNNEVLLSSVKKKVDSSTKTVALKEHRPNSSFTKKFCPQKKKNMKKSFIEQGHDGSVVFNPPIPFDCEETLISVKTSSTEGSTLNYSEYMFYPGTFPIRQLLPSREFVKYTIYPMNKTECFELEFITYNSQEDVAALLQMANDFSDSTSRGGREIEVRKLYRDKPEDHSTIVKSRRTGILATYIKDNNGDLASSINNQIKGLFFFASPNYCTSKPPLHSYFGDYRIQIPPGELISEMNMYFADFYCLYDAHYVTLVVTKPGSDEDDYCSPRLVRLDDTENRFLMFRPSHGEYLTRRDDIWVEVLYTQNINLELMKSQGILEDGIIKDVRGWGESNPNGLPKKRSCKVCNLPKQPYFNPSLLKGVFLYL